MAAARRCSSNQSITTRSLFRGSACRTRLCAPLSMAMARVRSLVEAGHRIESKLIARAHLVREPANVDWALRRSFETCVRGAETRSVFADRKHECGLGAHDRGSVR